MFNLTPYYYLSTSALFRHCTILIFILNQAPYKELFFFEGVASRRFGVRPVLAAKGLVDSNAFACAACARLSEYLLEDREHRVPYLLLRVGDMRMTMGSEVTALSLYEEVSSPARGCAITQFRYLVANDAGGYTTRSLDCVFSVFYYC